MGIPVGIGAREKYSTAFIRFGVEHQGVDHLGGREILFKKNMREPLTFSVPASVSMSVRGAECEKPQKTRPFVIFYRVLEAGFLRAAFYQMFGFLRRLPLPVRAADLEDASLLGQDSGLRDAGVAFLFSIFMVGPHPERPTSRVRSRCLQCMHSGATGPGADCPLLSCSLLGHGLPPGPQVSLGWSPIGGPPSVSRW
ncbi:MAG TPA: hypothetical protein DFR83_18620 [Deltaproteobacteria bacterium]|nr:hypothetical protein [Deltaproteobacteria bacterium]